MTTYAIQAGATRANPNGGPDGVGVQADIAYTLEARAEVQAVLPDNDNRPVVATASNTAAQAHGEPLRFLSVCSGIEAASVAWPQWQAVAFSEIEKFPSAVLAHHYPDVPNLGDFTKIDTGQLGRVDILCGGTPCQAFSVAGMRGGLNDARGNLTLKFVELAHALAAGNGLRNVVWENVVGVLSDKGNAFGCFLGGLVGADAAVVPSDKPADGKSSKHWKWRNGGRRPVLDDDGEPTGEYVTQEPWHALTWPNAGLVAGPKGRAAWRVCDAQYWGVAQRRRRVIVVADFGNGADPAEVLFEREGLQRHTPPSREARKDVAPTISARTKGGGGLGTDFDLDGGLVRTFDRQSNAEYGEAGVASTVSARDYKSPTDLVVGVTGEIAHTLKAEGADAGEDGTGRGTPIVAFTAKDYGGDAAYDLIPTLRSGGHSGSHANAGVMPAINVAIRGREGGATAELCGEVATALRASQGGGDKPHVLAFQSSQSGVRVDDVHATLDSNNGSRRHNGAFYGSTVRRLTPVECERLQGFPDNYTAIPWRGKPADQCPDGPRYKALGNSWAVPLFAWLGKRIDMHMPRTTTAANDNKQEASIAA